MTLDTRSPYSGYLYSYPHKTAYGPLNPPVPLRPLWQAEDRSALALYLHVPFCEMRCGFCNLFTASRPPVDLVAHWVVGLRRQAAQMRDVLAPARFANWAIGGGTPTMLEVPQLEAVLQVITDFGAQATPASVETSPATATPERLQLLRQASVQRISIGVQSLIDDELRAAQRPQTLPQVEVALHTIRELGFPVLNVDLIYGLPGQTQASFDRSLNAVLTFHPEEVYLYPLYVRPLTGMALRQRSPDDAHRSMLYTHGRDRLISEGYTQESMRLFRRHTFSDSKYECTRDGTVGLGVGARSYTHGLHYASDYAVGPKATVDIISRWASQEDYSHATRGIFLDSAEQARRRFILEVLALRTPTQVPEAVAEQWAMMTRLGWVENGRLSADGVARADLIGPALVSPSVRDRMAEWRAS